MTPAGPELIVYVGDPERNPSFSCRQPGDRYRSWDPARRGRFEGRIADMLLDPRCTQVRP